MTNALGLKFNAWANRYTHTCTREKNNNNNNWGKRKKGPSLAQLLPHLLGFCWYLGSHKYFKLS